MKTQHVTCNTQQKWTSSDNGPSCPTDTGCLWNLHMCCQHIHSTGCSSPSLRGRPVSELCRRRPGTAESAAAGLRAQVRKRLLDWKRLWWCCTVRARDICGVQKELRWVLGGVVLVRQSRRTILAPLSGLQLGALGLVSGEAGLLRCRSRRRSTGNGYSYEVCNPTCLKLPELLEYDVLVVCLGAWLPHRRQPTSTPPHRRLQ